jgi:hypothetical protein
MISANEIKKYLKEWEKDYAGNCHDGDWHLEWRKLSGSQCFKYIGIGQPTIISLKDETVLSNDEHLVVWDFRKGSKAPIFRIQVVEKVLYLSPFTGKMH